MQKKRHGCLTAWLVFLIIASAAGAILYIVAGGSIAETLPNPSAGTWAIPVLIVACVANLACAIALFQWKKWGFYGLVGIGLAVAVVNFALGIGVVQSLFGLVGLAILYGVLQIGEDRKGWTQLE